MTKSERNLYVLSSVAAEPPQRRATRNNAARRSRNQSSAGFQPVYHESFRGWPQDFEPAGQPCDCARWWCREPCRLEIGDTAGWKPALRFICGRSLAIGLHVATVALLVAF